MHECTSNFFIVVLIYFKVYFEEKFNPSIWGTPKLVEHRVENQCSAVFWTMVFWNQMGWVWVDSQFYQNNIIDKSWCFGFIICKMGIWVDKLLTRAKNGNQYTKVLSKRFWISLHSIFIFSSIDHSNWCLNTQQAIAAEELVAKGNKKTPVSP
jgi:hypothetical protein